MNHIIEWVSKQIGPKAAASLTALLLFWSQIQTEFQKVNGQSIDEFVRSSSVSEWMPIVLVFVFTYVFRRAKGDEQVVDKLPATSPESKQKVVEPIVEIPKGEGLPIGVRQNNPLNIRPTDEGRTRWQGEVDSDSGYALFKTAHHGLRAAAYLLRRSYFKRRGLVSVRQIIERWAPYGDNHPDSVRNYIFFVSAALEVDENESLRIHIDDKQLATMIRAMGQFENAGRMPYSDQQIHKAIQAI